MELATALAATILGPRFFCGRDGWICSSSIRDHSLFGGLRIALRDATGVVLRLRPIHGGGFAEAHPHKLRAG